MIHVHHVCSMIFLYQVTLLQVLHNPYFAITAKLLKKYQKLKLRIANSFLTNILLIKNSLLQDIPTSKSNFLPINEIQRLNPLNFFDRLRPKIPLGTHIPT